MEERVLAGRLKYRDVKGSDAGVRVNPGGVGRSMLTRARGRRFVAMALSVGAVLAMTGCDSKPGGTTAGGERKREGVNVLLISLDTTRADRLGCYGCKEIKTPNIDKLASEGVLFEQCTSVSPITLPAHASIMTGSYPLTHGVRDNGAFRLHENNETVAERLKAAGYRTTAEVATVLLNREYGVNQGFDEYGDMTSAAQVAANLAAYPTERKATDVTDAAIAQLGEHKGRSFFQYVHYFDPHRPWEAPPRFGARYKDGYLAEIAYVDEQVGRLLDELKDRGLESNTAVILTANHGESLGEHGETSHSIFVYDATVHVPLIMRFPGRVPAGKRVAAQVRQIDLPATIAELTGTPAPSQNEGVSLMPLIRGETSDLKLSAYSESMYSAMYYFGCSGVRALRRGGWKYIHAPQPELYDLTSDPGETKNLAEENQDKVGALRAELKEIIESAKPAAPGDQSRMSADPAIDAAIASLGYASGADSPSDATEYFNSFELRGADPKDYAAEIEAATSILALNRGHRYGESEAALRELIATLKAKEMAFEFADAQLGSVLLKQNKNEEAAEVFGRIVERRPEDGLARTNYGAALAKAGRTDEAIEQFHEALKRKPVLAQTRLFLALAYTSLHRIDEALFETKAALEINPRYGPAHAHLGSLLELSGNLDEALAAYRKAVECAPNDGRTHLTLGRALLMRNQVAEAALSFRNATVLSPQSGGQAILSGLQSDPRYVGVAREVAWELATSPFDRVRNGPLALQISKAARLVTNSRDPMVLDVLAAAQAEVGRFDDAQKTLSTALGLIDPSASATQPASSSAPGLDMTPEMRARLIVQMQSRLTQYREQKPFRQPMPARAEAVRAAEGGG